MHLLDLVGNDSEGRKQSQASVTRIPMLHPRTFTHYLSIVIRRSLLPTLSARVLSMRRGGPRGYYFRASTFTYVRSFTMSTKMQCLHDGKISSSNLSCVKKSVHGCVPAKRMMSEHGLTIFSTFIVGVIMIMHCAESYNKRRLQTTLQQHPHVPVCT